MSHPFTRIPLSCYLLLSMGGCGLFVDDVSRGLLADAGAVVTLDATHADRLAETGGHDGASDDASADARGSDVGVPDTGARDAATRDATLDAHSSVDAGHGPGFCATAIVEATPGALVLCDDFDEGPELLFAAIVHTPSTLATESTSASSAPTALLITADPPDGGPSGAYLQTPIAPSPASGYTLEFDFDPSLVGDQMGDSTLIASLTFGASPQQSSLAIAVAGGADGGVSTMQLAEYDPGDGGERAQSHPVANVSLPAASWAHVRLDMIYNGSWLERLEVNSGLVAGGPLGAGFSTAASPATVQVGLIYVAGRGERKVYFDNILVESF